MGLGKSCAHVDGIGSRDVAEAVLLDLVAVEATEAEEAAECSLEHVGGVVGLATDHDGEVCGHIVCILDHILIAVLGKLPSGETVDLADIGCPCVDNLHIFLCEVLDGSSAGFGPLHLIDLDCEFVGGDVTTLDDDLAGAIVALVLGGGDLHDNLFSSVAGCGFDGDPAVACGSGPGLLCNELGFLGGLHAVEVEGLGLELDIGHFHTIEIVVEVHVLDGIPDILVDVVLEEVIVEADHDEEGAHCGNDTVVIAIVDHAFTLTELLEVTDGRGVELGATGQVPTKFMAEELDGARQFFGEVDDRRIVGVLVPRIGVEAGHGRILGRCRDRLRERLTVTHRVHERIALRLKERGTLDSDEVHDTLSCDAPAFCCGVLASIDNGMPYRELALIVHGSAGVTT